MRHEWDEEFDAIAEYCNDGNDFYYEWVSLYGKENDEDLTQIFERAIGTTISAGEIAVKVKIKHGKAIYISIA